MSNEHIYNPFSRKFWSKENLLKGVDEKKWEEAKAEFVKVKSVNNDDGEKDSGDKIKDFGNKVSKMGWKLSLLITLPVLLTVLFGTVGLVIGGIIFLVVLFKMIK